MKKKIKITRKSLKESTLPPKGRRMERTPTLKMTGDETHKDFKGKIPTEIHDLIDKVGAEPEETQRLDWKDRFQNWLKSKTTREPEEVAFEPEEEIIPEPIPEPTGVNLPDLPPGKDLEFKWTGEDEMKYGSHPEEGELGDDQTEIDTEDETDYEGSPVPGRNYFKPLQEIARRHFKTRK